MKRKEAFASDPDRGLYFWSHSDAEGRVITFSNRPHELLPYPCALHRWHSDAPCRACDDLTPPASATKRPLPRAQMELPWS
jgi:hypothetical protein